MPRKLLTLTEARTIAENHAAKYNKRFHIISYSGNPCTVVTDEGLNLISRGGKIAVEILYSTGKEIPALSLVTE